MSNSQLPTQKGTGPRFEQVLQQPTKVVVNGTGDDPVLNDAALAHFGGPLRQFHIKQQQAYALSDNQIHKGYADLGGAQAIYTNIQGQEVLHLDVHPETVKRLREEGEPPPEYWQWAIIETTIPNMTLTHAEMSAFMNPKPKNKVGVAEDQFNPVLDLDKPPLAYPSFDVDTWVEDFFGETDQISSLRVDLRPYPGGVKFDLYGYIHKYQDGTVPGAPSNPQRAMWRGSNGVSKSTTYTLLNGITQSWWSSGDISGRTQTNYQYKTSGSPATSLTDIGVAFPAIVGPFSTTAGMPAPFGATWSGDGPSYAGLSITWTPGHNTSPDPTTMNLSGLESAAGGLFTETTTMQPDGVSYAVRGLGMQTYTTDFGTGVDTLLNGAGPTDSMGNWSIEFFDYTIYHVAQHSTVPHYAYPQRDCPVNFAVFDGPEADEFTGHDTVNSYSGRWESSKWYPRRWVFKELPEKINLTSIDDPLDTSITNHFGMVKLGTVIINPLKGKGGIKFVAA